MIDHDFFFIEYQKKPFEKSLGFKRDVDRGRYPTFLKTKKKH